MMSHPARAGIESESRLRPHINHIIKVDLPQDCALVRDWILVGYLQHTIKATMSYYSSSPEAISSMSSYYTDGSSRPSSTSPTFSSPYSPELLKMRLDAGRGFFPEDDTEFCPALTPYEVSQPSTPRIVSASITANTSSTAIAGFSPGVPVPSSSGQASTPTLGIRTRRALEIIDPVTGLRVR